jgi:hypothetical protein
MVLSNEAEPAPTLRPRLPARFESLLQAGDTLREPLDSDSPQVVPTERVASTEAPTPSSMPARRFAPAGPLSNLPPDISPQTPAPSPLDTAPAASPRQQNQPQAPQTVSPLPSLPAPPMQNVAPAPVAPSSAPSPDPFPAVPVQSAPTREYPMPLSEPAPPRAQTGFDKEEAILLPEVKPTVRPSEQMSRAKSEESRAEPSPVRPASVRDEPLFHPRRPEPVIMATSAEKQRAPIVRVTIGRIEVHAATPPSPPPTTPRPEPRPALSLEDYLKRRNGSDGGAP